MADDESIVLPWEALEHTEGDIPCAALERSANAVVAEPRVAEDLDGGRAGGRAVLDFLCSAPAGSSVERSKGVIP